MATNDFRAILNNVRITPRKAGLIATAIRGKRVSQALDNLKLLNKKGAPIFSKLVQSAVANATDRATVDVDRLIISEVYVNKGLMWSRFIPRAQGRATQVLKRGSNITLKVKEI
jgi:large subunit ribosomal protein L22